MNFSKILIAVLFMFSSIIAYSQAEKLEQLKSNKPLYEAFQKFYVKNIREETKDEWGEPYYYTAEIYGVNFFDYNNDGSTDCFIEFSSRASDGGTFYFLTAVLFEKFNNEYRYISNFHPFNMSFEKFSYPYFIYSEYSNFTYNEKIGDKKYLLLNNKFVEQ